MALIWKVSRKLLGHKSVDTTNRSYMHIMLEELSEVLALPSSAIKETADD
jgi:integrase